MQSPPGITRYQWLVLLVAWLGWVFDSMDSTIYTLVLQPALRDLLQGQGGGAVSQELSSSRSFLAHWCSPGRLTPRNRSRLPIVYNHIRSATRMVVSRVRHSSAPSRGGVPSGVPTRGSWAHTVVYVADRSYSSDRWEPHSRSLTMTRVFTITAALICVCSASLASAPSSLTRSAADPKQ